MARVFITGSTDGLGLAAGQALLGEGHEVVFHARSAGRARDLPAGAGEVVIGDLSSGAETRSVAEQVNTLGRMDAVIHNAGIYTAPTRGNTPEGHAITLAVNTLAPFILTALIAVPDRLVFMSSGLHRGGEGSLGDIDWTSRPWDGAKAYAETKLHLAALAGALARRWPDVLSNSVDPGWVRTRMGGPSATRDLDRGQRTQSWLAVSDDPEARTSGGYWNDRKRQEPASEVTDAQFQDRLVERLTELTGVALPIRR